MIFENFYAHKKTGRVFVVKKFGNTYSIKDPCSGIYCVMEKAKLKEEFVCVKNHQKELRRWIARKAGKISDLQNNKGKFIKNESIKIMEGA